MQLPSPVPLSALSKQNIDLVQSTQTMAIQDPVYAALAAILGAPNLYTISGDYYTPSYCSVELPAVRPFVPSNSQTEERLFIVCSPCTPKLSVLEDIFCCFSNLISDYLTGKTYGYACYSTKESANCAMKALNGQKVLGNRLVVIVADPTDANSRTRPRFDN